MQDNALKTIVEHCSYLLNNSPAAEKHANYLNTRLNKEMQEKFGFGYFPGTEYLHLLTDVVGEDTLKGLGLLYEKEIQDCAYPRKVFFDYFEDQQLVMPYKDVYGNIIALVGRSLLNDDEREKQEVEKYKNTRFTKGNHLFGLYESKETILRLGYVYVVEGQFDVIKAFEKGITNIVALGSSSMTTFQLALLSRYTNNILLLLDNDEPGERGRRAIIDKYGAYDCFQNVYLPSGYKDIDEYLKENDADSMSFLVRDTISS